MTRRRSILRCVWLAAVAAGFLLATSPSAAQQSMWARRSTTGPSPRAGHAMAYDSARGVTVLFGGASGPSTSDTLFNDTWEWDGTAWTLRTPSNSPRPRVGGAMAYDAARHVCVLYGGYDPNGFDDQTCEWNGTNWVFPSVTGIPPNPSQFGHRMAMAYDSTRGVTVLFGSTDFSGAGLVATYTWNGTGWTKLITPGPCERAGHDMAYDSARGAAILFGGTNNLGCSSDNMLGDTWAWNGTAWMQKIATGPSSRTTHALAFDAGRSLMVLFGGINFATVPYPLYGDTWAWNGTAWNREATTGPSPRHGHAMAYDSARGVTVLFGGTDLSNDPSGDTWEYGPAGACCNNGSCSVTTEANCPGTWTSGASCATAPVTASASPNTACPGQTVALSASGGSPLLEQDQQIRECLMCFSEFDE